MSVYLKIPLLVTTDLLKINSLGASFYRKKDKALWIYLVCKICIKSYISENEALIFKSWSVGYKIAETLKRTLRETSAPST